MRQRLLRCALPCLLLIAQTSAIASDAVLTVIGDLDRLSIGQTGFCGARNEVSSEGWPRIVLRGDEQVWLFASSTYRGARGRHICRAERTFIPASGKAYVFRFTQTTERCVVELFRAEKGADPVRERLIAPEGKSCVMQALTTPAAPAAPPASAPQ